MIETPALEHLMGAYFHQDWFSEHRDEWENLNDFVDGEQALVRRLPGEIELVLSEFSSDEQIKDFLLELGSCYTTRNDPGGYREWLWEIARRVQARLAEQN